MERLTLGLILVGAAIIFSTLESDATASGDAAPIEKKAVSIWDQFDESRSERAAPRLLPVVDPGEDVKRPPPASEVCEPDWKRHCSKACNGEYGTYCFFSTVCNPNTHRCEKVEP